MRVSVIIPLFNQTATVTEAVTSALAQTLPPFEVVIADDGSTDSGGKTLAGLDPRVRVIHQENRGPASARNLAARAAAGDWLAFLDADDLWLPQKLERQKSVAEAHPTADLIHTDGYVVSTLDAPLPASTFFTGRTPPAGPNPARDLFRTPLLTPAVMVRREAFMCLGGFNEKLRLHEDIEFYFRLAAAGAEFAYLPEPLVVVRVLETKRDPIEYLTVSAAVQDETLRAFPAYAADLGLRLSDTWRALGLLHLAQGNAAAARTAYFSSLRHRGLNRPDLAALVLLFTGQGWRLLEKYRPLLARFGEGSPDSTGD